MSESDGLQGAELCLDPSSVLCLGVEVQVCPQRFCRLRGLAQPCQHDGTVPMEVRHLWSQRQGSLQIR